MIILKRLRYLWRQNFNADFYTIFCEKHELKTFKSIFGMIIEIDILILKLFAKAPPPLDTPSLREIDLVDAHPPAKPRNPLVCTPLLWGRVFVDDNPPPPPCHSPLIFIPLLCA